jgi:hypothetical protein
VNLFQSCYHISVMDDDCCVYTVEWTTPAGEDLFAKVRSHSVAKDLVMVAREALDAPPSRDGGMLGSLLWRRGLTPQRREDLDAAAARNKDLDDSPERAWDYVLAYKRRRGGYLVLGVYTNGELAAGLVDLASFDYVPES